jgi:hypothetical protein
MTDLVYFLAVVSLFAGPPLAVYLGLLLLPPGHTALIGAIGAAVLWGLAAAYYSVPENRTREPGGFFNDVELIPLWLSFGALILASALQLWRWLAGRKPAFYMLAAALLPAAGLLAAVFALGF